MSRPLAAMSGEVKVLEQEMSSGVPLYELDPICGQAGAAGNRSAIGPGSAPEQQVYGSSLASTAHRSAQS